MSDRSDRLVTDDEYRTLIMSLAKSRGDAGFTQDEVSQIGAWADRVRIDAGMLACVLSGVLTIDLKDGEVVCKAPPIAAPE